MAEYLKMVKVEVDILTENNCRHRKMNENESVKFSIRINQKHLSRGYEIVKEASRAEIKKYTIFLLFAKHKSNVITLLSTIYIPFEKAS